MCLKSSIFEFTLINRITKNKINFSYIQLAIKMITQSNVRETNQAMILLFNGNAINLPQIIMNKEFMTNIVIQKVPDKLRVCVE